jgi:hypothetical protein
MSYICFSTLKITGSSKTLQRFKNTVRTETAALQFGAIVAEPEPWLSELVTEAPDQLVYKLEGSSIPD